MTLKNSYGRPPTKRMVEKLQECLEKEKNDIKIPCMAEEMKSSLAGLYKRGFVDTRMEIVSNKRLLCIFITETGKQFLRSMRDQNFPDTENN